MSPCEITGCAKSGQRRTQGILVCSMHYGRWQRHKDFGPALPMYGHGEKVRPACAVEGCSETCRSGKARYCQFHQARTYRNGGDPGPATRLAAPAGVGHITADGYRTFYIDGKAVREHRLVMEQMLGRKLLPGENVHHKKNGDRTDNRPENLELWSTSQPPGQRVTDKIEWALELLALYAPELLATNVTAVA